MPAGVLTVTSTVPDDAKGEVAVMLVVDVTVKSVAGLSPNEMPSTSAKFVPVMVTLVPPPVGPLLGLIPVTVGAPAAAL
jgi:hypothetical protein